MLHEELCGVQDRLSLRRDRRPRFCRKSMAKEQRSETEDPVNWA
jgi:hypothetical protein